MSLSVRHLNADSTFLLTFSSCEQPQLSSTRDLTRHETFTILLDPWLSGPSDVFHAKFASASHTVPSAINHLSEIPPPNVVLISQDKADHCHEKTLRQLDPSWDTIILAQPAAAKKIRGWKHFDPSRVHALPIFSDRRPDSIVRFSLPSPVPGAIYGEVTIAFMNAKRDITGLHNAIGITYRPTSTFSTFSTPSVHFSTPPSPSPFKEPAYSYPVQDYTYADNWPLTPPDSPDSNSDISFSTATASSHTSTLSSCSKTSSISTAYSLPTYNAPHLPKTLSVIYSPHGVQYSYILPYATTHLISRAALPLTLLLHSFDRVQNSWYLGGNINAGMPGGLAIAQNLLAKYWIGAHDEDKENTGLSVQQVKTQKHSAAEVRALVERDRKGGKLGVDVRALDCGEEMLIRV